MSKPLREEIGDIVVKRRMDAERLEMKLQREWRKL
jgi:hypothetical protein